MKRLGPYNLEVLFKIKNFVDTFSVIAKTFVIQTTLINIYSKIFFLNKLSRKPLFISSAEFWKGSFNTVSLVL